MIKFNYYNYKVINTDNKTIIESDPIGCLHVKTIVDRKENIKNGIYHFRAKYKSIYDFKDEYLKKEINEKEINEKEINDINKDIEMFYENRNKYINCTEIRKFSGRLAVFDGYLSDYHSARVNIYIKVDIPDFIINDYIENSIIFELCKSAKEVFMKTENSKIYIIADHGNGVHHITTYSKEVIKYDITESFLGKLDTTKIKKYFKDGYFFVINNQYISIVNTENEKINIVEQYENKIEIKLKGNIYINCDFMKGLLKKCDMYYHSNGLGISFIDSKKKYIIGKCNLEEKYK